MDMAGEEVQTEGIQVLLSDQSREHAPHCPHGPTLLFVKTSKGKEHGRRFYACSACRDRKDCRFFQWADEKVSQARLLAREEHNRSCQPPITHQQYVARFQEFIALPLAKRKFCRECQLLLLEGDWPEHPGHHLLGDVSLSQMKRPSQLLVPLKNKKSNAQYLFTDRSCTFFLDTIISLGFTRVLCVGTPRLHEWIRFKSLENSNPKVKSFLLDIDFRYSQFYGQDEFCHYNMFNHHFFGGEAARSICQKFLQEDDGQGVIMVTDPPFGGLVEPLAFSFKRMSDLWRMTVNTDDSSELPMLWIFPYFFESRILQCFPDFRMLDYQVDYDNHTQYKHGRTGRKQSPVRIFTNITPESIILPANEGYSSSLKWMSEATAVYFGLCFRTFSRFCSICKRYVSAENKHCEICMACTSKDGRMWSHCSLCNKCVKPSWSHCSSCGRCALEDHPCGSTLAKEGCFLCGDKGHKRSSCPRRLVPGGHKKMLNQGKKNLKISTKKSSHIPVAWKTKKKQKKKRKKPVS